MNFAAVANALASPNNAQLATDNEPMSVVGNKVLYGDGQLYIPEGISIYGGLESPHYQLNLASINAQIIAAAKYWHANTVRLQIAESNLFTNLTPGKSYNDAFLEAIIQQVKLAHSYGMAVVLNDQTEFTNKLPGPTIETVKFWKIMSHNFGKQSYVIFDLFNEPRMSTTTITHQRRIANTLFKIFGISIPIKQRHHPAVSVSAKVWRLWKYGGQQSGIAYVGMQTLVNQIRGYGANNLIWIEGPDEARVLPYGRYLIKGSNIVYSIHHPNLNDPASWTAIGQLSEVVPVVDGEWSQYQSPWAECYSQAYTNVSLYLDYLLRHDIGVIAWSLQPGSLLRSNHRVVPSNINSRRSPRQASDLKVPNRLLPSYSCNNEFGQGAGQILQQYFAQNSFRYNP